MVKNELNMHTLIETIIKIKATLVTIIGEN